MYLKKVLIISDADGEVSELTQLISQTTIKYSPMHVKGAKEALHTLMGSPQSFTSHYPRVRKVRPDIILLDSKVQDISAMEFLTIIRNYYSLKHIRVFLMLNAPEEEQAFAAAGLAVNGYLHKPFSEHSEDLNLLKTELSSKTIFAVPFIFEEKARAAFSEMVRAVLLKGKSALVALSYSTGAKIAACSTVLLISGAAATLHKDRQVASDNRMEIESTFQAPETLQRVDLAEAAEETTAGAPQKTVPVQLAAGPDEPAPDTSITQVVPAADPDTVKVPHIYQDLSIRVAEDTTGY